MPKERLERREIREKIIKEQNLPSSTDLEYMEEEDEARPMKKEELLLSDERNDDEEEVYLEDSVIVLEDQEKEDNLQKELLMAANKRRKDEFKTDSSSNNGSLSSSSDEEQGLGRVETKEVKKDKNDALVRTSYNTAIGLTLDEIVRRKEAFEREIKFLEKTLETLY